MWACQNSQLKAECSPLQSVSELWLLLAVFDCYQSSASLHDLTEELL
jgi:hypothetical protein